MIIALKSLHIIVCFILILVVLLQTGKGSEMGAVFGGSSQTVFGSGGAAPFLSKFTTGTAVVFMLTSLLLATISVHPSSSLMDDEVPAPLNVPATIPLSPTAQEPVAPEATGPDFESKTAPTKEVVPTEAAPSQIPPTPVAPKTTEEVPSAAH